MSAGAPSPGSSGAGDRNGSGIHPPRPVPARPCPRPPGRKSSCTSGLRTPGRVRINPDASQRLLAPTPDLNSIQRRPTRRRPRRVVKRCRLTGRDAFVADGDAEMIRQVVSDARQILHYPDAVLAQQCGRTQSRQHQELWRVDCARAEDHLASSPPFERASPALVAHAFGAVGRRPAPDAPAHRSLPPGSPCPESDADSPGKCSTATRRPRWRSGGRIPPADIRWCHACAGTRPGRPPR